MYHSFRSKVDCRKLSILPISCFLNELTFLHQSWSFFQKVESSLKGLRAKVKFQTFLVRLFSYYLIIWLRSESPQLKQCLISSMANLIHELLNELPNDLRLRILGKQEILEKCQMWVNMQPNGHSFLPETKR